MQKHRSGFAEDQNLSKRAARGETRSVQTHRLHVSRAHALTALRVACASEEFTISSRPDVRTFPRPGRKKQGFTTPVEVMTAETIGALQMLRGKGTSPRNAAK